MNKYYICCDETRVENEDSNFMAIGALVIPENIKVELVKQIKTLKQEADFYQEIKWNKVGKKYKKFYQDILELFIRNPALKFRVVIIDKRKIDYQTYHNNNKELAFFKFYYLLLREILDNYSQYYILLDKKPTRNKNRARSLKSFLDSHALFNRQKSQIKHLQAYDSYENVLIQMADYLTGLIGHINNESQDSFKLKIAQYLQNQIKIDLTQTTRKNENKLNILKWEPKS